MDDTIVTYTARGSSVGHLQRSFNAGRASLPVLDSKGEADFRKRLRFSLFGSKASRDHDQVNNHKTQDHPAWSTPPQAAAVPAKLIKRKDSSKLKQSRRASLPARAQTDPTTIDPYHPFGYRPKPPRPYDTYTPLGSAPETPGYFDSHTLPGFNSSCSAPARRASLAALRTPPKSFLQTPLLAVESEAIPTTVAYNTICSPTATESSSPYHPGKMYSSTVTVKPVHPTSFGKSKGLYSINEQAVEDHGAQPAKDISAYPVYPGLQTASKTTHGLPARHGLKQPRKLSGVRQQNTPVTMTTHASKSPHTMRETARTEMRISTWGHRMNDFPIIASPSSPHSPLGYQRPDALRGKRVGPNERFAKIPGEILRLILDHLGDIHLAPSSSSCSTCWMRDLGSIALASRKWSKHARAKMYEDIQIIGPDSAAHKKKFKLAQGPRLLLLRRTLRSNRELAAMVRFLKVPQLESPAKGSPNPKLVDQYDDLVSTLVMACPNLERLSSSLTPYDHTFKRVHHALSTRTTLRQMDWLVEASPLQKRQQRVPKHKSQELIMPEDLLPFEEQSWLNLHTNWAELRSLSIHCLPGATLTPTTLLPETLTHLSSLQALHLCNIPANAFNDDNLLALPRLRTLTLTHITGITSNGLSTFATRASSANLEVLHLRHTPVTSLAALARIFSNLTSLKVFALVQAFSPRMPEADAFTLWMMPYLASNSLKKLHWDITSTADGSYAADGIFAKSIAAGGFPSLKKLRVPNDPDGLFQALCRPMARIELPSDRFRVGSVTRLEESSAPSSPIGMGFISKSSTSSSLTTSSSMSSVSTGPEIAAACTNLRTARLAAQARLEAARCQPLFRVKVTDDDELVEAFDVAGYIGDVGSQIQYYLHPDAGSTDEKGGLVNVRDLASDSGESLYAGRGEEMKEGCSGVWNRVDGVVADKKEKEKWWHTERGRWTRMEL